MFQTIRHSRGGFTMMELMIVIAIIGILMGLGMLPYGQYMQQARLKNAVDGLSQEWILFHKEIRNGKEFPKQNPTDESKHSAILLHFEKGKNFYTQYAVSGDNNGNIELPSSLSEQNVKKEKEISFESGIKLLSLTEADSNGKIQNGNDDLYYFAVPPYASGNFYNDLNISSKTADSSHSLIIGYDGAENIQSGRAKSIFLRPYLQ